MMHNVDFSQNPEQLFGVFTTPENIKRVKEWMRLSGLNQSRVYTFDEFINEVARVSSSLRNNIRHDITSGNENHEVTEHLDRSENYEIEK